MRSMTGYAQREFIGKAMRVSLEIKSYNNRYLDIFIQLPSALSSLEPSIRSWLQERAGRGKVEFAMRVREWLQPVSVTVDRAAAISAIQALTDLSALLGEAQRPALSDLLKMEGVVTMERDIRSEELWDEVRPALESLFELYDATRSAEGERLKADMLGQAAAIESALSAIADRAPEMERAIREGLRKRFEEVLGNAVDEARIMQETAVALTRFTINEEIVRLGSHLKALRAAIERDPAPGKILDFLCQEMNREINTIGSKSQLVDTAGRVVVVKEAIENIREQARNVI